MRSQAGRWWRSISVAEISADQEAAADVDRERRPGEDRVAAVLDQAVEDVAGRGSECAAERDADDDRHGRAPFVSRSHQPDRQSKASPIAAGTGYGAGLAVSGLTGERVFV